MNIKVIREKTKKEKEVLKEKVPYIVRKNEFWYCPKCGVLYGEGEELIEEIKGHTYCPIHTKCAISYSDLDYWKKNYILKN